MPLMADAILLRHIRLNHVKSVYGVDDGRLPNFDRFPWSHIVFIFWISRLDPNMHEEIR